MGASAAAVEGESLLGGGDAGGVSTRMDKTRGVGARVAAALAALALVALALGADVSPGNVGSAWEVRTWPGLGASPGGDASTLASTSIPHTPTKEGGPLPDVDPLVTFNTPSC